MSEVEIPRSFQEEASQLLKEYTGNKRAQFHSDQLETIYQLVQERSRVLLVQRTGWGKSGVYFIATKLLRGLGAGPTLLVSPLLALMRDQIKGASSILKAETINSTNRAEWSEIEEKASNDEIDILLVAPERLANEDFRNTLLPAITRRVGLFVVDEAHCISNWGHDFRPDYKRIKNLTSVLPTGVPLLACTATANQRVIDDVNEVMKIEKTIRGPLERKGLKLHSYVLDEPAERLAWLAKNIHLFEGSGIIYVLTIRDADRVADWLASRGITAKAYSAALPDEKRIEVENDLLENRLDVVVATTALGMGFDHPALKFVIHFQSPQSVIHYYQQVGRAGRRLSDSYGILFKGIEDDEINKYFIENAFPSEEDTEMVMTFIESQGDLITKNDILKVLNISSIRLDKVLKHLEIQQGVERIEGRYRRTLNVWEYDASIENEISEVRYAELAEMKEYLATEECRNTFLMKSLDDPQRASCGICQNCLTEEQLDLSLTHLEIENAQNFLNDDFGVISPRIQGVPSELRSNEGRFLACWGVGLGSRISEERNNKHFSEDLLNLSESLIKNIWQPEPFPAWVTVVPSNRYPGVMENFGERLAERLSIDFLNVVVKNQKRPPQRYMLNSYQQRKNVQGCFEINKNCRTTPVLLLDDVVDSGWTLTEIGKLLRENGVENVYPFALADTSTS